MQYKLVFLYQGFNSLLKRKKIIFNNGYDNILVNIGVFMGNNIPKSIDCIPRNIGIGI